MEKAARQVQMDSNFVGLSFMLTKTYMYIYTCVFGLLCIRDVLVVVKRFQTSLRLSFRSALVREFMKVHIYVFIRTQTHI